MSASVDRLRVAVVTNIPAPYRLPVYERVAQAPDLDLHVIYSSGREPDREWNLGAAKFAHIFLKERFIDLKGRFIHINQDVWVALTRLMPDIVITTGFNPTHLLAYLWCRVHGAPHVPMTDGTLESETSLTPLHRWVRRRVYSRSCAFIAASEGGMRLYRSYGIDRTAMFKSHLCADNALFFDAPPVAKRFDFMFCGRFVAIKNPHFALEVVGDTALRLGRRVSMVFVGSGQIEAEIRAAALTLQDQVDTTFAGFARQEDLPEWYGAARVFLFPTLWDPWGVVANEACAAGVPVLVSPAAGCAEELVRDGENGYVLPLERARWVEAAVALLTDVGLHERMSARARELVAEYSYENAAAGIAGAIRAADRASQRWSSRKPVLRRRVVIVQRRMTHYRVPLFEMLRTRLDALGIDLAVIYGDPTTSEKSKADSGDLPWATYVPVRYLFGDRVCWQNALPRLRNAHLVVITQENRLMFNYILATLHGKQKWAFWGHGRNFQARSPDGLSEQVKRWFARHADWWFAYTELSASAVIASGFRADRVTVLNNAIDTAELAAQIQSLTPSDVDVARRDFGIGPGRIGLCLGSLHADKRLAFLFDAAERIRARVPDFRLVLMGDGPQRDLVTRAVAAADGWIHWLGARGGLDKARILGMSELMLNPGMVGLSLVDAFVAGVPLVTTTYRMHSPEIAYLESGRNGLITADDAESYAAGVTRLLTDADELEDLRTGCRVSSREYTLEHMVERFCDGIIGCLALPTEP